MKDIFEMFRKPSADVLAQRELEEAQRQLLTAHAGQEYAAAMVHYHKQRIARLTNALRGQKVEA